MLYQKLKGKIVGAGYTLTSFAKEFGVCRLTLRYKLTGRRPFTVSEIIKFCQITGITDNDEKVELFLTPETPNR